MISMLREELVGILKESVHYVKSMVPAAFRAETKALLDCFV